MFTTTPWQAIAAARHLSDDAFDFGAASRLLDAAPDAHAARLSMGDVLVLWDAAQSNGLEAATAALFAGDGNAWTDVYFDLDAGITVAASGASGTGFASSSSHAASRDYAL